MDDEKLIELVKDNSALYDFGHKRYTDNNFKAKIWTTISKELNATEYACKRRWYSLRDQYRKNIKKGIVKWKYGDELTFLYRFMKKRGSLTHFANDLLQKPEIMEERLPMNGEHFKTAENESMKQERDPTEAFFTSICAKVKLLPPYYRNVVESKIFSLVQEFEMSEILNKQQEERDVHFYEGQKLRYTEEASATTPNATYFQAFSYNNVDESE